MRRWVLLVALLLCGCIRLRTGEKTFEHAVVFVCFGAVPRYLRFTLELAARTNPVVLITDKPGDLASNKEGVEVVFEGNRYKRRLVVESLQRYSKGALEFAQRYVHLSTDKADHRRMMELQCIQRWFVLRDYMRSNNLRSVFFGDGDVAVFTNMDEQARLRAGCDAVINVEFQPTIYHWVGAGESSLWSQGSIDDFCGFTSTLYASHLELLQKKAATRSTVTDMSLLYLYWVAHRRSEPVGWATGRAYRMLDKFKPSNDELRSYHKRSDDAFRSLQNQSLPHVEASVRVCNGMDVVNRTVFDHMHGWTSGWPSNFSLNINGSEMAGRPYVMGASLRGGGAPEDAAGLQAGSASSAFEGRRLWLNTLHYQGRAKDLLPYDVCRVLKLTPDYFIQDAWVRAECERLLRASPLKCQKHPVPLMLSVSTQVCA